MAYKALYRRYRPTNFDEVVGQKYIIQTIKNSIAANKVGHAYLFCGARGTGKTTAAKVFARAINCLSPKNGSPCGECEACKKLANPANLDILEMDAASNNKVENVRDIRDKIQYPPVAGRYKVYIIDEVHMLTTEAFNALLKTLEEPPRHAVFILATTESQKIPATILSRCMRFGSRVERPPMDWWRPWRLGDIAYYGKTGRGDGSYRIFDCPNQGDGRCDGRERMVRAEACG